MEQALYLKDSYLKEFEAEVISVMEDKKVILDKTCFYPSSGGQPNDKGVLIRDDEDGREPEEFNVIGCRKIDGEIVHEIDNPGLQVGDKVHGKIDWTRRFKLMRMHTAAHLISEVIHKETRALITGNQLDLDKSRIDFSVDDYDPEKMKDYIAKANEIIQRNLPITTRFLERAEAEKLPQLSKLAKGLPESIYTVRIVSIGDYDTQADGGTHVKSTIDIGTMEFLKSENKGKNNRRVYFCLK